MGETMPYEILFQIRPEHVVVGPVPTPDDIEGSKALIKESVGSRLVRVGEGFVAKFGIFVNPIEAHNMLFVAKSTKVPLPKVYAAYQRRPEGKPPVTYIVMEYVPGTTLLEAWEGLDQARRTAIAGTLRIYFDELRKLPSPGYIGDIFGGAPLDDMFSSTRAAGKYTTAFTTEDELTRAVLHVYALEGGERLVHKGRFYQHVLPAALRDSGPIVFTHKDLQRKNIMLRPDGTPVIIDWEFASWYPSYSEYATATFCNGGWHDDWHEYVRMILDEYPTQAMWLAVMKLEIWS